ncbi:hypothetical protein PYCC9005_000492 [Savitreella phatthalungensis]
MLRSRVINRALLNRTLLKCYSSLVISDPFLAYQSLVQAGVLRPDDCQLRAAKELQKLYRRIEDYQPPVDLTRKIRQVQKVLKNRQSSNPIRQLLTNERDRALVRQLSWEEELLEIDSPRGLMLSGSVGTGKSMLIDMLLPLKKRWHYNALVLELFHRLNRARDDEFILLKIAYELIEESPILAIDEFQLGDAAAARILKGVLIYFWKMGGVLVCTSNRMPEDLYSSSFQAEQYKSFTELLATRCVVHDMRSGRDFRRECEEELAFYYSPTRDIAPMETLITELLPNSTADTIPVYGRRVNVPRQGGGVAHFTFDEICLAELGPADYISLAHRYHTFVIDSVPVLTLDKKNEARRFISLLDALYEAKCRLVIRAEADPDMLFFPDAKHRGDSDAADLLADSIAQEAFSETYYDVTNPNRPNISSYREEDQYLDREENLDGRPISPPTAGLGYDAPEGRPTGARLAPDLGDSDGILHGADGRASGAGSTDTGVMADERATRQQDFGRLSAFTGADEQFAFRRAASRLFEMTSRTWHTRSAHSPADVRDASGALLSPIKTTTTTHHTPQHIPPQQPAQTTSPFRTHPQPPPKFSFVHFWQMVQRGGDRKPSNPDDWKK